MTPAPVDVPNSRAPEDADDEEMPRVVITRRRALLFAVFVLSSLAFLYFVLPRLAGFGDTWHRLSEGNELWLGVACVTEALAFACYGILFRTVCLRGRPIGWRATYQITLAGLAATRLFAAMRLDKKVSDGEIRFVLAKRIGKVAWGHRVSDGQIHQTLATIVDGQ